MEHQNYCGHALRDITNTIQRFKELKYEESAKITESLKKMLITSQKFILPKGGLPVVPKFVPVKLPYGCIAIEFEVDNEDLIPDEEHDLADKSIALLFNYESMPEYLKSLEPYTQFKQKNGFFVWAIPHRIFKVGVWAINWVGAFVEVDTIVQVDGDTFIKTTPIMLGEYGENKGQILKERGRNIEYVARMESSCDIYAALNLCTALNCSNVSVQKAKAAKRHFRDKSPKAYFEYHYLTVNKKANGANGSHNSPNEHLRKGHLRHYKNGKTVWVNDTVINAGIGKMGNTSTQYPPSS